MELTEENTSNTMIPTMFDYHHMTGEISELYYGTGGQGAELQKVYGSEYSL